MRRSVGFMRHIAVLVFVTAVLALTFQAFADPATFGDADTARPGGVYVSLTTNNAAACSQLCARDGICMAWTYREAPAHACELKAVVTSAIFEEGAYSGLSARAPDFTREMAAATAPAPHLAPGSAPAPQVASTQHAPTQVLLGGPDDDAIRPRLGQ